MRSAMTTADLFGFALRALSGHRLRTLLSLLGMAIGVAAVITLTALGEGARRYVVDQFANIGSNLLIVVPGKTETTGIPGVGAAANDLTLEDSRAIERGVPEAEKMAPFVIGTESVAHGGRRRQVAVVGSTRELLEVRKLALARGEFLPAEELRRGRPVVVLGVKVARELFPGEEPVGQVVRIGGWRMRVIGILAPKGVQLGADMDETAVVPVATGMRMFDRRSLFRIMIQVREGADLEAAKAKVVRLLAERHGEEDVTVLTQDSVVATFSQILGALTLALGAIAAISLSVAGIGIMNVMLVSVSERTREVGLLRALGVRRGQVLAVFLTESALLSAAGGLLGLAAGWGAVRILIRVFPALPASPPVWAVVAAIVLSLGVGLFFGWLPARRAARLDPVAALAGR
jgi:putative ABC transport system permease protein